MMGWGREVGGGRWEVGGGRWEVGGGREMLEMSGGVHWEAWDLRWGGG